MYLCTLDNYLDIKSASTISYLKAEKLSSSGDVISGKEYKALGVFFSQHLKEDVWI